MKRALALSTAVLFLAGAGATQDAPPPAGGVNVTMVPIHTNAADPAGGAYGIWAVGPDYKVSFHDGFVFYPVLGPAYPRNLPLRWTTESIAVGGAPLVTSDSPARQQHSAWRFEYHYDGVTEAYDVLEKGVEQTFVLHRRPVGGGDLVVEGRITTDLVAAPVADAPQGLLFTDGDGKPIVEYGAAIAFDGAGRRTDVRTGFDGDRIRLTLPGDWLSTAAYPVTVDPLTTAKVISQGPTFQRHLPVYVDVARDDELDELLTCFTRKVSATDWDAYAVITDDRFDNPVLIFSDVTAAWDTVWAQCCFVGGVDRWAIVIGRQDFNGAGVRVYLHGHDDKTLNSGLLVGLNPPAGKMDRIPTIGSSGGTFAQTLAYVAFQRDTFPTNTDSSQIWGVPLDCSGAGAFGTPVQLSSLSRIDAEYPSITKQSHGGDWVVVWEQRSFALPGDDWDILAARIDPSGSVVDYGAFGENNNGMDKFRPKIAGSRGRYLCLYLEQEDIYSKGDWGTSVLCQRGDWSGTGSLTVKPPVTLRTWSGGLTTGNGNRGIAYDNRTDSHWSVAFVDHNDDVYAYRVGYNGGIVESRWLYRSTTYEGRSPSMVFNDDDYTFATVYATNDPYETIYGTELQYYDARCTSYGSGCAGIIYCAGKGGGIPRAGSEFFALSLNAGAPYAPYWLLLSNAQGNLPLGNGCSWLLGSLVIAVPAGNSSSTGYLNYQLPLPDLPLATGTVYAQFIGLTGGWFVSTRGVQIDIL